MLMTMQLICLVILPNSIMKQFFIVHTHFYLNTHRRQKRLIFSTITAKMNLSEEVDLEEFVARPDRVSGADINAICQEAGMHAVRENRYVSLTFVMMTKKFHHCRVFTSRIIFVVHLPQNVLFNLKP